MKKCFALMLIVSVLLSALSGCAGNMPEEQEQKKAETSAPVIETAVPETESPEEKDHVRELKTIAAGGMENNFQPYWQANTETALPEQIVIYVNPYPISQEGRQYEKDDAMKAQMREQLGSFLRILLADEEKEPKITDEENKNFDSFMAVYETESLRIASWESGLEVTTTEYGLQEDTEPDVANETLLSNPVVSAALEYLGIQSPCVIVDHRYLLDGSLSEYGYYIVEDHADLSQRMWEKAFRCIRVSHDVDRDAVSVRIKWITPEEFESKPVLPYAEALEYVERSYPDAAVLGATACYSEEIDIYHYLPCYQFILEMLDTNGNPYHIPIYISMTVE